METLSFDLLLRMLIAHFLSDFVLQKKSWAEKKISWVSSLASSGCIL
jgi:hypothetical protein